MKHPYQPLISSVAISRYTLQSSKPSIYHTRLPRALHRLTRFRTMSSTIALPSIYNSISVKIPPHIPLTQTELVEFPAFKSWISRLTSSLRSDNNPDGYTLRHLEIISVVRFGSTRIGFLMLNAEVRDADDKVSLPGTVLLRGPSVGILALLHPEGTPKNNLYVILVLQPRLAGATTSMAEIPAGMLDDHGSFAGAAAKEIEEEVGITISEDKLINLSELAIQSSPLLDKDQTKESIGLANAPPVSESPNQETQKQNLDGLFSSAGLLDEVITYHAFVHEIPEDELEQWKGRLTGLRDKGERITLKLVRFDELWKATRDSKALCAWALWKGLEEAGRLPY
ncbi:hypothetical protein EYR41_008787 [Orbilia oligospora]|uniref:Uncharacterized protein n=1 Tax=Orbilia oligospora TaxID=2813651 RepID=A0A7C8PS37_ORBOL|nr:hypothetical protein TWF751_002266 [Orbilia oligospora]KAF3291886.1 hypothetical protein TWF132_006396 [Orbilia oligospora]TGJ67218.1 hypothetical protein EYR41_008787 [Orbilia oligospora]